MYISIDGLDYSGKDSQLETIRQTVIKSGIAEENILMLSEPGGCQNSMEIRELLLHNKNIKNLSKEAELLLYAAARFETQDKELRPFLKLMRSKHLDHTQYAVISNRSHVSSFAYQAVCTGRAMRLYRHIHRREILELPDIEIILMVTPKEAVKRLGDNVPDRLETTDIFKLGKRHFGFETYLKERAKLERQIFKIDSQDTIARTSDMLEDRLMGEILSWRNKLDHG